MKRMFVFAILLLFAAPPVIAGTRSCTASMVSLNICRATTDVAYCLPISTIDPDNGGPKLAPTQLVQDAFASLHGWASPTSCIQEMVDIGVCSAGQLGTSVGITKAQFADMIVRRFVLAQIKQYRQQQEVAASLSIVAAEAAPNIGN